ncbi:MAG: HAD hydrolase-like protein [Chlorobiaceae bacterium]
MLKKLILFDIDGTLLSIGQINRTILGDALKEVYGTEGSTSTHDFAGKMDNIIIYEVLKSAGLSDTVIARKFKQAKATYIEMFRAQTKPTDITLMEGVRELLNELSGHPELLLGLLTGNFEGSGRHKLHLPDIDHFFPFGAFADDGNSRNALPPVAVEKAYQISGKMFLENDVVIIGDTEHDIACSRVLNAKSIAVATGTYSANELRKHNPDVLLDNLSRIDIVLSEIF